MARARKEDLEYFDRTCPAEQVAEALLGKPYRDRGEAVLALGELAADPRRLGKLLGALPGGALAAVELLADAKRPYEERELASLLELTLGAGRGHDAFRSLHGRGLLRLVETSYRTPRYELWEPFRAPSRELLGGLLLVDPPPDASPPGPDGTAFAVALLLGQLVARPRRVAASGALYRKEADELEALFAPVLGRGLVTAWTVALERMEILHVADAGSLGRASRQLTADAGAAESFLREPRPRRARRLAGALELPGWLRRAFAAGERFVPRAVLDRSEKLEPSSGADGFAGTKEWIPFLVAAGVLEERGGAYRIAPGLRGGEEPARPAGGRWHVQPNLEVLVPPDAPLVEVFQLARVAELASVDRAAVLRLTPTALARAADQGLARDAVVDALAARAAAPIPDVVRRAVVDHVQASPAALAYEGTFVVAPGDAIARLRARPDFAELVRNEIAPGVLWLARDPDAALRKAFAAVGAELRFPARREAHGSWRRERAEQALEGLLASRPARPCDGEWGSRHARAAAGEAAEFARTERPVGRGDASTPEPAPGAKMDEDRVWELLDAVLDRIEGGRSLDLARLPSGVRVGFVRELEQVLKGRLPPARTSQSFQRHLALVVGSPDPASSPPATASAPSVVSSPRSSPAPAPAPAPTPTPTAPAVPDGPPRALHPEWEAIAREAIASRRDVWIRLADERRPRLVTPHRVAARGGERQLEALAHESGDLRVFAGERIAGAAAAGPSLAAHLPRPDAAVVPLRAARNEKCPCGSGRKYKQCCLPKDLAGAS